MPRDSQRFGPTKSTTCHFALFDWLRAISHAVMILAQRHVRDALRAAARHFFGSVFILTGISTQPCLGSDQAIVISTRQ